MLHQYYVHSIECLGYILQRLRAGVGGLLGQAGVFTRMLLGKGACDRTDERPHIYILSVRFHFFI